MTTEKPQSLADFRARIDAIDSQILTLLKERLHCAREIGRVKAKDQSPTWDPKRERLIFERLEAANGGEFPWPSLRSIYGEIITTCRLSQNKVKVAYMGPEATFSHLAGAKCFGQAADYRPTETIEDVFVEVERGRVEYGMVPVENSIEGAVTSTLDAFVGHRVRICGEVNLAISHNLVNASGDIKDIKQVVSHPQPLAQCRQWLRKNLPGIPCQGVFSTAVASQMAAKDGSLAAVASAMAVKTYGLQMVVRGIEDYSDNTTRFLVLGKESPPPSGADKTSLLFSFLDRPGALHDILSILAERDINLTRIESRPMKGGGGSRYLFFIDLLGHWQEDVVREGCELMRNHCSFFEWLGSYPVGREASAADT